MVAELSQQDAKLIGAQDFNLLPLYSRGADQAGDCEAASHSRQPFEARMICTEEPLVSS